MASPSWKFILTDLQGSVLGEVMNASNRQVVLPLNRLPTAGFQIPIQNWLSPYLLDPNWDGLVKAYRNNVLRFCGPIVSSAEAFDASGGQTVQVNAASPLWRLQFRLLGTTPSGWALGTATTPYDLGYIAQQMLAAANAAGYTGITQGTNVASSQGSAGTYWFKDVLTAIAELSVGLNSFDFEAAPTEPTNIGGYGGGFPQLALFNTANVIGAQRPNAIFEFGTPAANVVNYSRQIDRTQLATKGYMQQPAVSDYSGTLTYTDAAAEAIRGRYEALIDNGGVQWDSLRTLLLQENILIRKQARQVVEFLPKVNASPDPFTDYIVGDQVRARINVEGKNVLDAMMRVWGITFAIDNQGNEQPTLELVQPAPGQTN